MDDNAPGNTSKGPVKKHTELQEKFHGEVFHRYRRLQGFIDKKVNNDSRFGSESVSCASGMTEGGTNIK